MMDDYLVRSGVEGMLKAMVEELKPANPTEFMVQYLQNHMRKEREREGEAKKENERKRSADCVDECEEEYEEMDGAGAEEEEFREVEMERAYVVVPESFKRMRRGAICCDIPKSPLVSFMRPFNPKSPETRVCLEKVLAQNIMFSHLDEDQIAQISNAMYEVHFKCGDVIFRQGDDGDTFYVVGKGECDVFTSKFGSSQHVATHSEECVFGELALIYGAPRAATVKARTDAKLWSIDRVTFQSIVRETTMKARKIYESFLEKVPILAHLTKYERATIADSLTTEQFWDGDVIVKQGENGDSFFIILDGSVEITRFGEVIGKLSTSQYFGEIALLTNRPRSATITSVGNTKCICLDRDSFNRLLGPIEDILRRNMEMYNLYISSNI